MTVLAGALLDGVLDRISRSDYDKFERQLRSSGYCARPVRLRGSVEVCDGGGIRRAIWSTDGEPDEVLRKACGNRREAVCGPCSERYRGDAWQLIAAGLRGGKGVPESAAGHPAVFASLTAPSFGSVHGSRLGSDGRPTRCHPRRDAPRCRHGVLLACCEVHAPDDPCVGAPLCIDCFDYRGAVVWNNLLGELWRRTMIYLPRQLAGLLNMTQKRLNEQVRVSYVKVAEYQARGLVHVHPLIRLDRRMAAYRSDELRAPDRRFSVELLEEALSGAVEAVSVQAPAEVGGGFVRWGEQLDIQRLSTDDDERGRRASYLAKYSTKSTEQAGGLLHRIEPDETERVHVREHVRRFLRGAFDVACGDEMRERRVKENAHAFGYRGHCLTKSRRWSTTFKALRDARQQHVHEQLLAHSSDGVQRELASLTPETRISAFEFAGLGHLTTADAYLAAQAAALAREKRDLGREVLYDHHNPRRTDACDLRQDQTRAA